MSTTVIREGVEFVLSLALDRSSVFIIFNLYFKIYARVEAEPP